MNATATPNSRPASQGVPLVGDDTLGVVGMGVMGCTILKGLLAAGAIPASRVWGTSRSEETCREVAAELGVPVAPDVRDRLGSAAVLVLCVKPAQAPAALATLAAAGTLRADALIVSIAAGVGSAELAAMIGPPPPGHAGNPIVRAMPNTPCVVGVGMTAVCRGPRATAAHVDLARRIFACVGETVETEEKHFDAITALSGSGPAYHYLIMEAMADAGVRVGLPRDLALALVAQTTLGAARMVQTSGRHPAALRDDVTTPAGCTIGGLLMLEDGKIRSVLARAIEEATRIASKLGAPKSAASPQ
jgi:pyrroline-5-carboxylate reductase